MRKEQRQFKIGSLLALLLLGVFAVCVLLVLLTGADVYEDLVRRGNEGYESRTAAQYLTTRVRQADAADAISLEDFGGVDALVLTEEIGGARYVTRVYCYDGWLRELFSAEETSVQPADGEKVLELDELHWTADGGLLLADLTARDGAQHLVLYPRSGREVCP